MMDMSGEAESEELDMSAELTEGAEPEAEEVESEGGDFNAFADLALDTTLPIAERRKALKEAIMACMSTDYAAEEEGTGSSLGDLSGVFGG